VKSVFGIDFGTSTSEIAVCTESGVRVLSAPEGSVGPSVLAGKREIMPSMLALDEKGQLVVGWGAEAFAGDEERVAMEFKRLMGTDQIVKLGGQQLTPPQAAAFVLRELAGWAKQQTGQTVERAVLSVPANFSQKARNDTLEAARIAGIEVIRLVQEPTAAALSYGVDKMQSQETILVFDWGGGTLDVTVLKLDRGLFEVQASYGDPALGGKDFDEMLAQKVLDAFWEQNPEAFRELGIPVQRALLQRARIAKEKLSEEMQARIFLPAFARSLQDVLDLDIAITREQLEEWMAPLLHRARAIVRGALEAASIQAHHIDRVLLVGGTTYVPAVRRMLVDVLGREPVVGTSPDLAVCTGSAILSGMLQGLLQGDELPVLIDVSPFGLGVKTLEPVGRQMMASYDALIEPNTPIPYQVTREYELVTRSQHAVQIELFQSQQANTRSLADAIDTGLSVRIPNIPPASNREVHTLVITFSYDANGVINLKGHIRQTGQQVHIVTDVRQIQKGSEQTLSLEELSNRWKTDTTGE